MVVLVSQISRHPLTHFLLRVVPLHWQTLEPLLAGFRRSLRGPIHEQRSLESQEDAQEFLSYLLNEVRSLETNGKYRRFTRLPVFCG